MAGISDHRCVRVSMPCLNAICANTTPLGAATICPPIIIATQYLFKVNVGRAGAAPVV